MEQYYTPSGRFSPISFILWLGTAAIALPILSFIYAYAIWYIPIPYLNFIITGIFGLAIGIVVSRIVLRIGKVRNGKLAFVFAFFAALTALYIHWAVWVDLVFNISGTIGSDQIGVATSNVNMYEVFNLLLQPTLLFDLMKEINQVGVWGIKGGTVSGGFLTFIWVVELIVVIIATLMTGTGQASKPFCEEEETWFEENELAPVSHFTDGPAFVKALSIGDMEVISLSLTTVNDVKKDHHAKITLFDAKSGENFVSIENQIAKPNDKGEIKFSTEEVTRFLKISQEVADKLKAFG